MIEDDGYSASISETDSGAGHGGVEPQFYAAGGESSFNDYACSCGCGMGYCFDGHYEDGCGRGGDNYAPREHAP